MSHLVGQGFLSALHGRIAGLSRSTYCRTRAVPYARAGCGGEWFGVPVPRLFLCVGALHPIRRQYTSSVRVQCPLSGVAPLIGCSAPVLLAVVAAGDVGTL